MSQKSHVFPRHTKATLPTAMTGDGAYLIDDKGQKYLDCGDAAVSCLGHSNPAVIKAVQEQVEKIAFAHSGFMTSEPAEALARLLIQNAPGALDRVYFVSGGSEATESAIKLARQYFLEIGQPERRRVIARKQSYHGNTLGALSAGGNEWRRTQFAPLLVEMSHIAPCYEYVGRNDDESSFDYGQRVANELESEILRLGPDSVMAFMAEPVVGATLGAVPSVDGYYKRIRDICDQYGVLLILDEVMCGMGRTGHLFACDHDGIAPDILCIAKGLGAGYQPIGAMLCTDKIYAAIENGSGFFQHGHTYLGHPVATAAALAVVTELTSRDLPARAAAMGDKLQAALEARFGQHPNVGDIRGRGLFRGLELVADRDTKTPFDPAMGVAGKIKKAAFAAGLICYPMSGTRDGKHGDHILLAPPFIITEEQIDELVDKLATALATVL
ncbi:aspartate aminotransferase family protein [Aliiroseovarius crassostreae]|uniref:Aspartate aminotransferase family protein n=1 Tax=Aliiroseovarius crassostreae TaxID=154981 RepID=A0A9Q9HBV0_9RHOB|nr:aspartate aminotransferase family protein [Aliiroseovarius crassostreae]UWP95339.1 aspartate aminotransferase family protein [Aliiroseovarius crassostreae]UWP98499.1 aspartate aminotransferase family protein [Aliiroseovarius crassostreae]